MEVLGHQFADIGLLNHALTHRSVLHESGGSYYQSNELLEFLGDAVLGLIVVEHLYKSFPFRHEGDLSKIKSILVSGRSLKNVAREMNLGSFISMSRNESRNGGRNRGSILEDTLEAVIAALYLDGGFETARSFINDWILPDLETLVDHGYDNNFKSQLLEYTQGRGLITPVYKVIGEEGPEHKKRFEIEVHLEGKLYGTGNGNTKKTAQQNAAKEAIKRLVESGLILENGG